MRVLLSTCEAALMPSNLDRAETWVPLHSDSRGRPRAGTPWVGLYFDLVDHKIECVGLSIWTAPPRTEPKHADVRRTWRRAVAALRRNKRGLRVADIRHDVALTRLIAEAAKHPGLEEIFEGTPPPRPRKPKLTDRDLTTRAGAPDRRRRYSAQDLEDAASVYTFALGLPW